MGKSIGFDPQVILAESAVQTAVGRMAGRLPQSVEAGHRLIEDFLFDPLGLRGLCDEVNAEFIRRGVALGRELGPGDMGQVRTVGELVARVRDCLAVDTTALSRATTDRAVLQNGTARIG